MYEINVQSGEPVYEQIIKFVLGRIIDGLLVEGDKMPSVRQFAADTGINPNTVSKAYKALEHDKIIKSVAGKGTFVNTVDMDKVTDIVLQDFDEVTVQALKTGIKKEKLIERINELEGKI